MSRYCLMVVLVCLLVTPDVGQAAILENCTFTLGFSTFALLLPREVGQCLDDETHYAQNGDAVQHTTGGLLVWRKADNWTAFTDGYHSWINGPRGIQKRLNTERFSWEAVDLPVPTPKATPSPTPVPTATPKPKPVSVRTLQIRSVVNDQPDLRAFFKNVIFTLESVDVAKDGASFSTSFSLWNRNGDGNLNINESRSTAYVIAADGRKIDALPWQGAQVDAGEKDYFAIPFGARAKSGATFTMYLTTYVETGPSFDNTSIRWQPLSLKIF